MISPEYGSSTLAERALNLIGEQYLAKNARYKQEQIRFVSALLELFPNQESMRQLFLIKKAKTRVEKILGQQEIGVRGFTVAELANAIVFDLRSAFGEQYTTEQVLTTLQKVNEVFAVIWNFMEYYLTTSRGTVDMATDYFDLSEVTSIMSSNFFEYLWGEWQVETDQTVEEMIKKLQRKTQGDLRFTGKIVLRFFQRSQAKFGLFGLIDESDTAPDEREKNISAIEMHEAKLAHERSYENSWALLGSCLREVGIDKLPLCLTQLSPREIFAVLRNFGYLYPEITVDDFTEQFGLDQFIIGDHFYYGVEKLVKAAFAFRDTPAPGSINISDFIQKYQVPPFYTLNGRVLPFNAARTQLAETATTLDLHNLLTDTQLTILTLAVKTKADKPYEFLYTPEEMGQLLTLSASTVHHTLSEIQQIIEAGEDTYINTLGERILPYSAQIELIQKLSEIPLSQLAGLSETHHEICRYMTTPDPETGRYHTPKEAEDLFKVSAVSRFVRDIVRRLSETTIIDELYRQVELYLAGEITPKINPEDKKVALFIKNQIESGESIGGWHPNSLNAKVIAAGAQVNVSRVSDFLIRIGIYGKKSKSGKNKSS